MITLSFFNYKDILNDPVRDARQSSGIYDNMIECSDVSDTLAVVLFYDEDKEIHNFSIYVKNKMNRIIHLNMVVVFMKLSLVFI